MSDYASVVLIPVSGKDALTNALNDGRLPQVRREDFVVINDCWIGFPTNDYYGANFGDENHPPEYLREISKVTPLMTFAHGVDTPEFGAAIFLNGAIAAMYGYFPLDEHIAEDFDFTIFRQLDVTDERIEQLREMTERLRERDEDGYLTESDGAYDDFKEILRLNFSRIDQSRRDEYR